MTSCLRSASLTNYGELARSLGLDPVRLLARAGLPPNCLDSADLRVSADAVMALLELSARGSGEQAFGLRLAQTRRLSTWGLVGILAREEPTLREAIATLALADPVMRGYAQQLLTKATATERSRTRHEVRQLILALLPTGRCNIDQVALHMGVDRRTVHRRLAGEGCTFSALLQQTRQELMTRHLNGGRLLSEIAPLLGFSSLSALSRWRRLR